MDFKIKLAQPKVWGLLEKTIINNKVGSAYLFAGPVGVGKEAMAIEFGAEINKNYFRDDEKFAETNYNQFRILQHELLKMVFPLPTGTTKKESGNPLDALSETDLQLLNEAIEKKINEPFHKIAIPGATRILISSIRELRKSLYLKSDDVGRKIVIIFDAHLLNEGQAESANALLKILEEPPLNTTIILVTDNKNQLLPTILSRCQHIDFPPLSKDTVKQYLIDKGIDIKGAAIIAGIAQGDMQKALSLSNDPIEGLMIRINELSEVILDENGSEWRKFINTNSQLVRRDVAQFRFNLFLLQIWFNSVYRLKIGVKDELHHPSLLINMKQFNKDYPNANLQQISILIEEALEAVGKNLYMSLILTNLLIDIHKNLK